ncbi:metal-dependent hydrolase [Plebeiibacterium sediminum]|uniref:Metal-dependent hydrolase n=1 Tax=Plebeiibacterium sediminum TaxID=2992112 RepID=A0AAE3M1Q5_9BACT|nr:metal-dependent hydrolase [Plebeiobacterium sediminum]MCW3785681.1 metal-dependent hydrolase [Plebeiobacterium sediminum]
MDILTHTLSGVAAASVVANVSNGKLAHKIKLLVTGAFAGALPDIDVITKWSGFDATFGKWFDLSISGNEAFGAKLWYSHHAFFHSLLASVIFGLLLGLILYAAKSKFKISRSSLLSAIPFVLAFVFGYNMHLLEDMVTPGGGWGGVAYLWPSKVYIGGFGDTWWWNNYDVFLIVSGVVFFNTALLLLGKLRLKRFGAVSILIFVLGFTLGVVQVKNRDFNFNARGTAHKEELSKEIQKEALGENVFYLMEKLDAIIPVAF